MPTTSSRIPRALGALTLVAVGACRAVGPDYVRPEVSVPDAWRAELLEGLEAGDAPLQTWWQVLGDPLLDELVERAMSRNLTLETAFHRVLEARAFYTVAAGDRMPQLDAVADVQRASLSDNLIQVPGGTGTNTTYGAGLDATWEIDVFGRVRRNVEASEADLEASIEDYRDVLVLLLGEVATTYIEMRSLQERVVVAQANVADQASTLQLTRDRFDAGLAPGLDVAQAERNLAVTESSIPSLQADVEVAIHRLGVLLGEHPSTFSGLLSPRGAIPVPSSDIVVGLPAELLRQRPDVRSAERRLAGLTARVGVATAAVYPAFSLSGSFRHVSQSTGNWTDDDSSQWFIGPSMRWNLFNGGQLDGAIDAAEERVEQALAGYELTVLRALEEVENAMVRYRREVERRDALLRAVDASDRTVSFVKDLYEAGLVDFQNVLDAQRELTTQQDRLAASEGTVVGNLVALYLALGGGWDPSDIVLSEQDDLRDEIAERQGVLVTDPAAPGA